MRTRTSCLLAASNIWNVLKILRKTFHKVNKIHYLLLIIIYFIYYLPFILYLIKKTVTRNIILVVGDGMSLTTATAARILRGQRRGQSGEDTDLAWDTFPAIALAKVSMFF